MDENNLNKTFTGNEILSSNPRNSISISLLEFVSDIESKSNQNELLSTVNEDVRERSEIFQNKNLDNSKNLQKNTNQFSNEELSLEKIILKQTLLTPLAQALINLFFTRYFILKTFLASFVLLSSGLASYLVIDSIVTYFNYEVVTISRTIYETPTLFPKVTFCNVNPFTTKYAYNLWLTGKYTPVHYIPSQEQKLVGHNLKDILIECWFRNIECYAKNFTWSFSKRYGNCYTFNSNHDGSNKSFNLKQSTLSGPDFGLRLTFYVNVYESFFISDWDGPAFLSSLGGIVFIGNSSYETYNSESGIALEPGSYTQIAVDREFKKMLPKPYSVCEIDEETSSFNSIPNYSELYNLIEQSNYFYSQQLCFVQCLQKYFINNYNCTVFQLFSLFNVTECEHDYLEYFSNETIFNAFIVKVCLPMCPLECNQQLFKASLSSFQLNGNFFIDSLNSNIKEDFIKRTIDATTIRESLVGVNIFYESLSYKESNELPKMNIVSLLGSIGGNLGLFLGVSVFTLCEIIEVLMEVYFIH